MVWSIGPVDLHKTSLSAERNLFVEQATRSEGKRLMLESSRLQAKLMQNQQVALSPLTGVSLVLFFVALPVAIP